ncbi:hypothetical protein [Methanopyrus kandleri]
MDVFDTTMWEREEHHPHGPAASLATVPDIGLKPDDVDSIREGLTKLCEVLSPWEELVERSDSLGGAAPSLEKIEKQHWT